MNEEDQLLTPADLAEWRGTTVAALAQERYRGIGPAFIKTSPRTVRYRRRDVLAWLDANTRTITGDAA